MPREGRAQEKQEHDLGGARDALAQRGYQEHPVQRRADEKAPEPERAIKGHRPHYTVSPHRPHLIVQMTTDRKARRRAVG